MIGREDGDLTGAEREHQEVSMLALHLLQSALVHVNTLLMQRVLDEPARAAELTDADRRALSPLYWSHVNPYGTFRLDMDTHPSRPGPRPGRRAARARRVTPSDTSGTLPLGPATQAVGRVRWRL